MARTGKIKRLSAAVRQELNERLHNGQTGKVVLAWLNGLEVVQAILGAHFNGAPINEPNLTAWRQNDYARWLEAEEARKLARELLRDGKMPQGTEAFDWMDTAMPLKVAELSRLMVDKESEPLKQWKRLCAVHGVVSRMRRDQHAEVLVKIRAQQWGVESL